MCHYGIEGKEKERVSLRIRVHTATANLTVIVAAEVEVAIAVTDKKNKWRLPNISCQVVKKNEVRFKKVKMIQ